MTHTHHETLTISGLYYEELVLLQELLLMVDTQELVPLEDMSTFNKLYDKVMNS